MTQPRVLVLGGTGFVGRHVCEQLARLGWAVTVPTRRAIHAANVQSLPGLTVLEASVHSEADLDRLMPGHDAVVNLVGAFGGDLDKARKSIEWKMKHESVIIDNPNSKYPN